MILILRENGLVTVYFLKRSILMRHFNVLSTEKTFAGHIKVLGGPNLARRPDVAQAWSSRSNIFPSNTLRVMPPP